MLNSSLNKILPSRLLKEIEEPILASNNAVFIQNSGNNSKITVYNVLTNKTRIITMKNLICFNCHSYGNKVVFEYSGSKRGVGILNTESMEISELDSISSSVILGGIWENYLVLRRGCEVILFNIDENRERPIGVCHHICGTPVIGYGCCGWLQFYKDKCCIVLYDIQKKKSLVITSRGYINKMYLVNGYIIYQNCINNKYYIYAYNISNGELIKIYENSKWIELYKGKDNTVVWTVRKEGQGSYLFDIYVFNICNMKIAKVLSDYNNLIIPTASLGHLLWIDGSLDRDSVYCMPIDIR